MPILCFEKPKKVRSTEEHNKTFSSDCGVAGTYVPNMSHEDRLKWKAKHIGGKDGRVEIRKSFCEYDHGSYSQVLIVVRRDGVVISMNGKTGMTKDEYAEFIVAIEEANQILKGNDLSEDDVD